MSAASAGSAPRYAPARPFPPYAYLPGRDPHPERDPRGHAFGARREPAIYYHAAEWRKNEAYLHGVDLYNHGYLWEAHEAWEGTWHASKHDAMQAELLQGLIQCAAASLKLSMEQPRGLEKLSRAGTARLQRVAQVTKGRHMGLDLLPFIAAFRAFAASVPRTADERPQLVLELED